MNKKTTEPNKDLHVSKLENGNLILIKNYSKWSFSFLKQVSQVIQVKINFDTKYDRYGNPIDLKNCIIIGERDREFIKC